MQSFWDNPLNAMFTDWQSWLYYVVALMPLPLIATTLWARRVGAAAFYGGISAALFILAGATAR